VQCSLLIKSVLLLHAAWYQMEGISVKSGGQLGPKLVKLVENPQLTETLDYVVHEGRQVVGRWAPDAACDIMLRGPLISESHWSVSAICDCVNSDSCYS